MEVGGKKQGRKPLSLIFLDCFCAKTDEQNITVVFFLTRVYNLCLAFPIAITEIFISTY